MRVKGWARDGLNDEQIADKIGICADTLYTWQKQYPEFSEAIKEGKAPVDIEVENALLKSALGFRVTVKKPIKLKTKRQLKDKGTIEEERVEIVEEEIYVPPQTVAQVFWLKNRRPDKWRDKPADVASGASDTSVYDALTASLMAEVQREEQQKKGDENE